MKFRFYKRHIESISRGGDCTCDMCSFFKPTRGGEQMDLLHDIIAKEDRISNLPDDIIHRILSFLDMKYAIQTSTLSKKWKHIWSSMPYLNLNSQTFPALPQFAKFVKHALSHRNNCAEVSAVELAFTGAANHFVVKNIVKYAYSHNVRRLSIIWSKFTRKFHEFPQGFFSSHTLKHLILEIREEYFYGRRVPISAWDFPALETLCLRNVILSGSEDKNVNLFSKCVNLKDLTLHHCSIFGFDIFHVCAPQLLNLTITDLDCFPKVFNMVTPQLRNLTASVNTDMSHVNGSSFLQLSTEGLYSLEKVNISLSIFNHEMKRDVPQLLDLFRKLRSAKFLILNYDIIQALSSCPDLLVCEPCPFSNLKCVKINKQKNRTATVVPDQVRNYFLESSPSATFIIDLPKVPQKRSRQEVEKNTMAKKVAKLEEEKQQKEIMAEMFEAKVKMQGEIIAKQKAKLQMQDKIIAEQMVMKLQLVKSMSQIIDCKMAEQQVQVAGGNPNYELIRSIKSIMELIPESLRVSMEARFSCLYKEMKSMFHTQIDASEWEKIEMELGITKRTHSDNIHSSNVPFPSPSSANKSNMENHIYMAAQNNNILRAQLPKLNGTNYHHWSIQMKVLYESQDLWNIVEHGVQEPPNQTGPTAQQNTELKENIKKDRKALFLIYQAVDEHIFERISTSKSSKEAWDMLYKTYRGKDKGKLQTLRCEFDKSMRVRIKMATSSSVGNMVAQPSQSSRF